MDKNSHANAGDMGSIPDPGRSHILWSNLLHAPQLLKSPRLRKQEKPPQTEACTRQLESGPHSLQLDKACSQQGDPVQPKINKIIYGKISSYFSAIIES